LLGFRDSNDWRIDANPARKKNSPHTDNPREGFGHKPQWAQSRPLSNESS
jgi:hypothetical protein